MHCLEVVLSFCKWRQLRHQLSNKNCLLANSHICCSQNFNILSSRLEGASGHPNFHLKIVHPEGVSSRVLLLHSNMFAPLRVSKSLYFTVGGRFPWSLNFTESLIIIFVQIFRLEFIAFLWACVEYFSDQMA